MARFRELTQTLSFRIAGLLAFALLPVGLISVVTTYQLLNKVDREMADTLMAITAEAAGKQETGIRTATGMAKTLVSLLPVLEEAGYPCNEPLGQLLRESPELSLVGYVGRNGTLLCSSSAQGRSLADRPLHREFVSNPAPYVKFTSFGTISETAVIVVSLPVIRNGDYDGYVLASLPLRTLEEPEMDRGQRVGPLELITFNTEGEVLTASSGMNSLLTHLPAEPSIDELAHSDNGTFVAQTIDGDRRVFALVPIVPNQVYALGSYEFRRSAFSPGLSFGTSMIFPFLMWLVSLFVAFYSVERMVIKPTRNLRARMLQFMRSRKLVEARFDPSVPIEIRDMEETWMRLAENILHDEAQLYDTIHQRTVLLKEVHHRVKNNLQLIVSIVGMKMRKARSPAVKAALSNVQQRVMSIARVHQNLYETSTADRVRVGELLEAIVKQIVDSADRPDLKVDLITDYQVCDVYPDQAVPLSLSVSEFVTNALKNIGKPNGAEQATLEVKLEHFETEQRGRVTVCNTLSPDRVEPSKDDSTGLGERLTRAFASQMEGSIKREETDDSYTVIMDFPIQAFDDKIVPSDHGGLSYKHPV